MIAEKDIGLQLKLNTGVDITSATVSNVHYRKPSGATGSFTGAVTGTYYVSYTLQTNDIDEMGEWEFQSYVEKSTWKLRGNIAKVRAVEALV